MCFLVAKEVHLDPSVLSEMPYMSALALHPWQGDGVVLLCVGMTGGDGFEMLGPAAAVLPLASELLSSELVRPAGLFCLDILRMEAGLPRVAPTSPWACTPPCAPP